LKSATFIQSPDRYAAARIRPARSVALAMIFILSAFWTGCRKTTDAVGPESGAGASGAARYGEALLDSGLENLNRLEKFEGAEVVEQISQRLEILSRAKPGDDEVGLDPLLAAWPEPEMLRQVLDRLNQWIRTQRPPADWRPDPMLAELPESLAELPQVKDLAGAELTRFDAFALREAVWLRDVGLWARGDILDDLERAKSLFDWTIRNIQIEPNYENRVPLFPWESLWFGRGNVTERAWVFILLARQLGIDAAMLAVPGSEAPENRSGGPEPSAESPGAAKSGETLRQWCVAVRIEGELYLFEPLLGIPIPAPGGVRLDSKGQLTIQPATLAQVLADDGVLRQLDLDAARPYGAKASELHGLTALLEASPYYLARRMKMIESRLTGARKMVLTTDPSASAERWKSAKGLAEVRLWLHPYRTLERRSNLQPREIQARLAALLPFYAAKSAALQRGRVLHIKGRFTGDEGATAFYQNARPSAAELALSSAEAIEKMFFQRGKEDALYWSGLIAYERKKYDVAVDFLLRTLQNGSNAPWIVGAQYNLGRALEARDDPTGAIRCYEGNSASPGYHGDLLRAKWLRTLHEAKKKSGPANR